MVLGLGDKGERPRNALLFLDTLLTADDVTLPRSVSDRLRGDILDFGEPSSGVARNRLLLLPPRRGVRPFVLRSGHQHQHGI